MVRRNLILGHRGVPYERDFKEIAKKVSQLNPAITVISLPALLKAFLPEQHWLSPTLTVVLQKTFHLQVMRGPVLRNGAIGKFRQQALFRRHGISTPPALPFSFGMPLDPAIFGDFVLLKPGDLNKTSKGVGIFLFRRQRLSLLRDLDLPATHPLRLHPQDYIAQRFVDTGPFPCHYRVQMLFDQPLYCWRQTLNEQRPPLDAPDHIIESAVVASQGGERRFALCADDDVLKLAVDVHRALPDVPSLGVDIVRDQVTGRLHVLECNAGGNTWHFSSEMGATCRAKLGGYLACPEAEADARGRLALIGQFGAFDRAAEVLAKKTVELAS
ncbi:hypothetical protein [Aestuariivirga sp.]|jgi:hypothetical protein|uniref:hypothetical protein n=1 Tax=Aestuariivirga sp. TaxID=2650926 RepID=UPI00378376E3